MEKQIKMLSGNQLEYAKMHGFDPNNIPLTLHKKLYYLESISADSRAYLHAIGESFSISCAQYRDVCIKDIYGTEHIRYANHTLLDAFLDLDRGKYIAKKAIENPDYYDSKLKQVRDLEYDEPFLIEYYGKLYIRQGNNRLITAKVMFELDLANGMPYDEITKKYTYKLRTLVVPLDKEIINGVILLHKVLNHGVDIRDRANEKFVVCTNNDSLNPVYNANINGINRELKSIDIKELAMYATMYKDDNIYDERKTR